MILITKIFNLFVILYNCLKHLVKFFSKFSLSKDDQTNVMKTPMKKASQQAPPIKVKKKLIKGKKGKRSKKSSKKLRKKFPRNNKASMKGDLMKEEMKEHFGLSNYPNMNNRGDLTASDRRILASPHSSMDFDPDSLRNLSKIQRPNFENLHESIQ